MKSIIVMVCAVVLSSLVMADNAAHAKLTPEQRKAMRNERRNQRLNASGGLLEQKIEGNSVLIANAQTDVPMQWLDDVASSIRQLVHIRVDAQMATQKTKVSPSSAYPVVVSVINDPSSDATILIAPEQSWATVNIAQLAKDKPAEEVYKMRIHKEVWRATAMAMGAANSMQQPCLMRQINTLRELDRTRNTLPSPQPVNNMMEVAYKHNIAKIRMVTYKRACEEGWAPAPTNDVQKAIWERAKADKERGPSNPIEIPMPKKK